MKSQYHETVPILGPRPTTRIVSTGHKMLNDRSLRPTRLELPISSLKAITKFANIEKHLQESADYISISFDANPLVSKETGNVFNCFCISFSYEKRGGIYQRLGLRNNVCQVCEIRVPPWFFAPTKRVLILAATITRSPSIVPRGRSCNDLLEGVD